MIYLWSILPRPIRRLLYWLGATIVIAGIVYWQSGIRFWDWTP